MKQQLFDITWAMKEYVLLLPLFFLVLIILYSKEKRIRTSIKKLGYMYKPQLFTGYYTFKYTMKHILFSGGFLFLLIALLRPQTPLQQEEVMTQKGRNLYVAFDVSKSMLAEDLSPNRLVYAKQKIKRMLELLSCERIGLILFSGSAFIQCPLTADRSAFFLFLDQIDTQVISSGSTALDQAIKQALQGFDRVPEQKNKLLVIITDGEDFSSNLSTLKAQAQEKGLHIFTLGIGTVEGAPIPLIDAKGKLVGHQLDKQGNVVITRLNEGILRTLSHDVGGEYISTTNDDADIKKLVAQIQSFEKENIEDKKVEYKYDWYPYCLLVSFICFAVEWLL